MTTFWQKLKRLLWRALFSLMLIITLAIIAPFTPIFANVSVFFLDMFSTITLDDNAQKPSVMVVLGGGLTKNNDDIILNHYSQSRADQAALLYLQHPLVIITSGAESPWLRDYLRLSLKHLPKKPSIISDNASMNTCENATFTAKLLAHHEMPNSVYLVTDRYHMARARRQFALSGIATTPQPAPLTTPLSWTNTNDNLIHSRRAIYEIAALARDIFRPQQNCRTQEQISLEEISTPRRKAKIFY